MEAVVSPWRGKRVLVTGASGLTGSWLCSSLLRGGARVTALSRKFGPDSRLVSCGDSGACALVEASVEDFDALERTLVAHEIEIVFHLAAQSWVTTARSAPLQTFEANARGTWNLLEVCRRHADLVGRVVIASTDKVYGDAQQLPYTEETPLGGRFPYDASKACADLAVRAYHATYGLPVVTARCGNTFGGGDLNLTRIVPGTIRSLLLGERPVIRSNGQFRRDYVYVQDAVAAYESLGLAPSGPAVIGQAFNFGSGQPLTVIEVVETITRIMGREQLKPLILNEAAGEILDQYLSSEKAERVLGWKPSYAFETALAETVSWYTKYWEGRS